MRSRRRFRLMWILSLWVYGECFMSSLSASIVVHRITLLRDTVNPGVLISRRLPFTTSNTVVRTFRHAVALDERRAKFKANLWNRPTAAEVKLGIPSTAPPVQGIASSNQTVMRKQSSDAEDELAPSALSGERIYSESEVRPTDVEEVWFSVCLFTLCGFDSGLLTAHFRDVIVVCTSIITEYLSFTHPSSDVGGGSVSNETPHSLARISLRWMIRECFKTGTGIMFDAQRLKEVGLDPATLYPFVTPRPPPLPIGSACISHTPSQSQFRKSQAEPQPGSSRVHEASGELRVGTEEEEELQDALSPVYDQLKIKWYWWVFEVIPLRFRYQQGDNKWVSWIGCALIVPNTS